MTAVSKDCFPAPTKCHNCERKRCEEVKKELDPKEEYKRCSSCHLMSYCDKDCQREHWLKVHKHHCRFLSGRVPVKNSRHDASTCTRCIDQGQASPTQLTSENSPKTICNIEDVIATMKDSLGKLFGFHEEGKKCSCSLNFALDLPFPLGEVSGQYVEFDSTGLDAMLSHAVNILTAMIIKCKEEDFLKNAALEVWNDISDERSLLWYDILVSGRLLIRPRENLLKKVNSLDTMCGDSKSWWKILKFSVLFVTTTSQELMSNFTDFHSLTDSYQNLKLFHDYQQSQLQKQAIVCEKNMWTNFMIWPGLVNGSLAMLLPPETRCQSCFAELSGEVIISSQELNPKTLACLLFNVGDYGALMACCPAAKNSNCRKACLYKNVALNLDEDQWKAYCNESELFAVDSRNCHFCLKLSLSSHRCSACASVQYCSTSCQKKDLNFHSSVCSTWAKDKFRRILGKGKQKDYWKKVVVLK